jgi:hypothetical protein
MICSGQCKSLMLYWSVVVSTSLSLGNLHHGFTEAVSLIEDFRTLKKKIKYTVHEICNSAFAMMYFQDPSLNYFQKRMKESMNKSNLGTMFGVENIPGEKRMRSFIDKIEPRYFYPAFHDVIKRIDQSKHLEQFKFDGSLLLPLDGTQILSTKSNEGSCKHCLVKNHRNGTRTYSHAVVVPMIVHPDLKQVLPLIAEEIRNEDGKKKQDCEINAAKRLIPKLKELYLDYKFTLMGDGLYAKQTLIDLILEQGYNFMLVVSPEYNVGFLEEVERRREVDRVRTIEIRSDDKIYCYEYCSEIAFKKTGETVSTNYIGLTIINEKTGEVTYKNTWATNLEVREDNVVQLVKVARSRWKVENEGFNVLKNQGYELEHCYGHGEEYLLFNFFQLTLLAHLYHQAHELGDKQYHELRVRKETKKNFWDSIRAGIRSILFLKWEDVIKYLLDPPELAYDPISGKVVPRNTLVNSP